MLKTQIAMVGRPLRGKVRLMWIKELPYHTGTLDTDLLTHRTKKWKK